MNQSSSRSLPLSTIHHGTLLHHHQHRRRNHHQFINHPNCSNRPQVVRFRSRPTIQFLLWLLLLTMAISIEVTTLESNNSAIVTSETAETGEKSSEIPSTIHEPGQNLCDDEFHKECHCGSIATPPATTLFTRIAYPNSTIVIEEYDEDVPYGYKYLRVYYRCTNRDNILVGNNMRECSKGNWIGNVPRCAINSMNQTRLKQININNHRWKGPSDSSSSSSSRTTSDSDSSGPSLTSSLASLAFETLTSGSGENSSQNNKDEEDEEEHDPIKQSFNSEPVSVLTIFYNQHLPLEPNGVFAIPLNNQPVECLRWSLAPRQVWSMSLTRPTIVHYVRIKLFGDHIEDLHLKHEIEFELILRNLTYQPATISGKSSSPNREQPVEQQPKSYELPPIEKIKCRQTIPKTSQFETYHQKYSANYLVLDWICETDLQLRSFFDFFFQDDIDIDQVFASVIEIRFMMLDRKSSNDSPNGQSSSSSGSSSDSASSSSSLSSSASSSSSSSSSSTQTLSNEFPFKPKIFVTSLCELKLYSFNFDCGMPDIPITAIVQRDYKFVEDIDKERKSYKYICSDKNYEVKGTSNIECSYYGKWKTDFPQCVPVRPCPLLSNRSPKNGDYYLDIKYEKVAVLRKSRAQVVPNGKYARLSCHRFNQTMSGSLVVNDTSSTPSPSFSSLNESSIQTISTNVNGSSGGHQGIPIHQGMAQIICQNGKWMGIKSINPNCRSIVAEQARRWMEQEEMASMQIRQRLKQPNLALPGVDRDGTGYGSESGIRFISNIRRNQTHSSDKLVSLPVRVIQVLFALFVVLCLVIVSLLVYMAVFRKRLTQLNSVKTNGNFQSMSTSQFGLISLGSTVYGTDSGSSSGYPIPTIVYNHHGGHTGDYDPQQSNSIYSSASNFYERISLEPESSTFYDTAHLYQTIQNRGSSTNSLMGFNHNNNSQKMLESARAESIHTEYGSDNGSSKIFDNFNLIERGEERTNSIYGMDNNEPDMGQSSRASTTESPESDVNRPQSAMDNEKPRRNYHHKIHQPSKSWTLDNESRSESPGSRSLDNRSGVCVVPKSSDDLDINVLTTQRNNENNVSAEYATVDRNRTTQPPIVDYNQLSRSSSMFMKQNSIYEQ